MSNGETGLLPTENTDVDERSDSMNLSLINKTTALNSGTMDGGGFLSSVSKRKDLPDDLACFLQQQKQRQARLETTMRSFPSTGDMEQDKMDQKKKRSTHEDPMSHRIIEKRRRDRMNNCLADLSRLIPSSYLKKGRGRIEKTEIIEMAIKHIRHLQSHPCTKVEGCELAHEIESGLSKASSVESFRVGYHECLTETMHFLVEKEGLYAGNSFCVRLMTHLQKHFDKLGRASTSEIFSVVGRTWPGTNLPAEKGEDFKDNEDIDREAGVKSEFGISSEESGYKTDEIAGNSRETCAEDPELPLSYSTRNWHSEAMTSDLPSDLSLPSEVRDNKHVEDLSVASSLYKFKSTIRHRFDSNRSCDDEFPMKIPEKRSRLDSTSTDRDADHSFDVDLTDTGVRRDSYSPGLQTHCRHESGPGPGLLAMSDHRHKSGAAEDFKIRSTSPIPGPSASSTRLPVQYIPVFALSTKGSYYIPLSVEASSLGPFVPFLTENNSGPCHPITISVKFSNFPGSQSSLPPMMPEPESPGPERPEPEWRNVRGQGGSVIHSQQSVIKNWRDQT